MNASLNEYMQNLYNNEFSASQNGIILHSSCSIEVGHQQRAAAFLLT